MNQSIIHTRYARALVKVGVENQCLDKLKADMELIGVTISEVPVFRQILDNPIIKPEQKRKLMSELLEKRMHPLTINFINLIIHNRREFMLADMVRHFIDLYEKSKGIKRGYVVSATEMDEQSKQQLQQQLNALFNADVQIIADEDPDLIGGFIFHVGDRQYDASLSSSLKRMRTRLTI